MYALRREQSPGRLATSLYLPSSFTFHAMPRARVAYSQAALLSKVLYNADEGGERTATTTGGLFVLDL
jgi:hypothetical protein